MINDDDDDIFSSNDDDVFNPPSNTSDVDDDIESKIANKRNRNVLLPSNAPGYLKAALERYISEHPEILESMYNQGRAVPESVTNYSNYDSLLAVVNRQGSGNAVQRAMISIIDEITEGELTRRSKVFEYERALIAAHSNLQTANTTYEQIVHQSRPQTTDSIQFLEYLTAYLDIAQFTVGDLTDKYTEACELAGLEPDEGVIEFGWLDEADLAYTQTTNIPSFKTHHIYGDMTEFCTARSKLTNDLTAMAMNLIFTGDEVDTSSDSNQTEDSE